MKFITVPLTKEAMKRLDRDSCIEGDLKELELNQNDLNELWKLGIFDILNKKLNLMIDDFEDEVIPFEKLQEALNILKNYSNNKVENLKKIEEFINTAIKNKTAVFFFF